MWFSPAWLGYEIARFVGFRLTGRAINRIYASWRGTPKSVDEFVSYDRIVRSEAVGELSSSENEILRIMNFAMQSKDKELFDKLETTRQRLENLRDSIEYARHLTIRKGVAVKGLAYLNLILLSGCFSIAEAIKDVSGQVEARNHDKALVLLEDLNKQVRDMDRLVHMRSLAIRVPEGRLLRILEADHPDIYEAMRSIAVFAFSTEEKKGLFGRGNYYERIRGRTLYVAKNLEGTHGPFIELRDFYLEFKRINPDVDISHDDLEKSMKKLADEGWIKGIMLLEGNKKVIFKLDHKGVIDLVHEDSSLQKEGLTAEELAKRTCWPIDYCLLVLKSLEEREIAKRVIGSDGITRWFFPGLTKAEKELN